MLLLGQRLLRKADFHLGQTVNTFFRIKCKLGDLGEDKKNLTGADKRHITMFGNKIILKKLLNLFINFF